LHHDALLGSRGGGPAVPVPVAVLLYLAAWQIMTAAMMLPTSLPMFRLFAHVGSGQARPRLALAGFLAAYAAVWTAFALAALTGVMLVEKTQRRGRRLVPFVGGGLLLWGLLVLLQPGWLPQALRGL